MEGIERALEKGAEREGAKALEKATETAIEKSAESGSYAVKLNLKTVASSLKKVKTFAVDGVDSVKKILSNTEVGIKYVDEAFATAKVTKVKEGFVTIGDNVPLGKFNKIVRGGDLRELQKALNSTIPTTLENVNAFKKLSVETPEKSLKAIEETSTKLKSAHPELNVTAKNLDTLSETAKETIKKSESKFAQYAKKMGSVGKVALVVGGVALAANFLIKAVKERDGCFMLTTINGKTFSCKISVLTCDVALKNKGELCNPSKTQIEYNTILKFLYLISTSNFQAFISQKIALNKNEIRDHPEQILDHFFEDVVKIVNKSDYNYDNLNPCGLSHNNIEKGIIPACRNCNPAALPNSSEYIDSSTYADNITYECITNSTPLDVISDILKSTGENILDTGNDLFIKPIKKYFGYGLIAVVVLIIISLAIKFLPMIFNKKQTKESVPYKQMSV